MSVGELREERKEGEISEKRKGGRAEFSVQQRELRICFPTYADLISTLLAPSVISL